MKIRDYYVNEYPFHIMGWKINEDATFDNLLEVLNTGGYVYDCLWVDDNVVRERVFEKLAEIQGVSYDDIYNQWMRNNNKW